jgi:hypothetical protein
MMHRLLKSSTIQRQGYQMFPKNSSSAFPFENLPQVFDRRQLLATNPIAAIPMRWAEASFTASSPDRCHALPICRTA